MDILSHPIRKAPAPHEEMRVDRACPQACRMHGFVTGKPARDKRSRIQDAGAHGGAGLGIASAGTAMKDAWICPTTSRPALVG